MYEKIPDILERINALTDEEFATLINYLNLYFVNQKEDQE